MALKLANCNNLLQQASTSMNEREEKMMDMQAKIEKNLTIIGATAIEDRLQDEVGETIEALKSAGIRVWVLTGDKVETAINIAYSCKLLNDSLHRWVIDGKQKDQALQQLRDAKSQLHMHSEYACIITGEALVHSNEEPSVEKDVTSNWFTILTTR